MVGARPRVVIVGAGFGGLTCARALRRVAVDVTLVDRNNFHLFTPLLYQVSMAMLDPAEIARPVRTLLSRRGNAEFRMCEVHGIDLKARRLTCEQGEILYDYLVLAAGSATNFYGNRHLAELSLPLKQLPEALALRNHVLSCFEAARWTDDPARRRRLLTFVIVGGGPTGVETAGALSELVHLLVRRDFRGVDLGPTIVHLLEAAPYLLGAFHPNLRQAAARALRRKGVELSFGALVRDVGPGWLKLGDGTRLEADTVIWTAGVAGAELGAGLGVPVGRQGRLQVESSLRLAGHPEVFVIGDMAGLEQGGDVLPMLIPVAMQQARFVGAAIDRLVRGRPPGEFHYKDPGIMATIGRNAGVAQLGRVRLSGFPGWVMWLVVHLVNVVSFRSRLLVLINWAWDYFFYDRPIRLIVAAREWPRRARRAR